MDTTSGLNAPPRHQVNAGFLRILPAIVRHAPFACRNFSPERRDDFMAEVVANAFVAYRRLAQRQRLDVALPTPLTHFAIRQVRAGRRVGCPMNIRDITSEHCQKSKGIGIYPLDRYDRKHGAWRQMVVEDRRAGPDYVVMVRLDFAAWLASLTVRKRRIAEMLAGDTPGHEVARYFRISPGRISQLRRELRHSWYAFLGEPLAA